ncbi:MAG: virulence RhuM family protein [Bacilli bacterium]|nr:virulence RhuM family protein [Bacilli bacterium]
MLYNLDVIISVGYRVKSKNGIIFRKWASEILKDYLLKGYVVSSSRALIADENYINLINEVNGLKNNVNDSKKVPGSRIRNSFVCYEGKFYVGFVFINELIRSAKERVVIIDGYADNGVLDFFVGSKKGITKTVLCHKRERIELGILERFIKQYGQIIIKEDKSYHDRFLIIDNDVYLLGASLNSLGNKTSTITKTAQYKIEDIYKGE